MKTRVRFKDGTEIEQEWPDHLSPATTLSKAIAAAEFERGEAHDGAWLEFAEV